MKKNWKTRLTAGFLAVLLGCSALFSVPSDSAYAASVQSQESPQAEDLTIGKGEAFDIAGNFTGIHTGEGDKVSYVASADKDGKAFDADRPGTYDCIYRVEKATGETYEVVRTITVSSNEKENTTPSSQQKEDQDASSEDEEPDPAGAEVELKGVTEEEAVFLSVVPSALASARENATLVQGEKIWYPSDLGSYSTCYFYVNDRLAYCIESNLSSPPSADYVAGIYESNLNLQKVLYYGYGGPGDLTGEYLKGYSDDMKYIMTHLAASTAYAGEEVGFTGCYESGIQKYKVREYIQFLYGQEAPPSAAISLSSTKENAYLAGDVQRTDEMTLNGDHRNYITFSLPSGVTYHDTDGGEKSGGTVTVYGGTTFYFTAAKTVHGTWKSGNLSGQIGAQWKTLVVSAGDGYQDVGYGEFYEEPSASVSFSIKWMDFSWVEVVKEDAQSKVRLAGAVFGLYRDEACTDLITKMPATDENGASRAELNMGDGTVYLKEISVPEGYKLNTKAYKVELKVASTQTVTVANEEQKGKIVIRKQGEKLSGVSGEEGNLSFVYENAAFADARYKVYAAEDIYSQDKQTLIHHEGDLVEELATGADGSCGTGMLYLGSYRIVEIKAPHSLTIGESEEERTKEVTLSYAGQTVELAEEEAAYTNARPKAEVRAVKKSENDSAVLEGAVFGLYAAEDLTLGDGTVLVEEGTLIQSVESDADGNAVFTADIPIGFHYAVEEIRAPEYYYMGGGRYEFYYEYKDDSTYTYEFAHTFTNKEVRGEVRIRKIDKDTQSSAPQGDGDLDGAVYGLYAAEDIQHPNGKSGLVWRKDELVAQGVIEDGKLDFTDLYLGSYYVQEISAPPSNAYLVDETKYPVELPYEGQDVEIVRRDVTVTETVKKQAFQLIKISEDGDQTETDLLEGVGFKVYLISALSGVKDGTLKPSNGTAYTAEDFIGYDFSGEECASYYENGEKIVTEEMFSDKNGYVLSPELPYGDYVVVESTVPEDMNGINPFLVTIDEDSREPQPWRVFDDRPYEFYFKIIKKDAQTGLAVLKNSAKYKIYDVEKEEYVSMKVRYPEVDTIDTFETNEEGYLQTPEQLKSGTYRIEEVESPSLFVQPGYENALMDGETSIPLNEVTNEGAYEEAPREPVTIRVDSGTAYEVEEDTGKYIIVVEVYNDEAVGSLTVEKTGEVLTGVEAADAPLLAKARNVLAGIVNRVSNLVAGEDAMEPAEGYSFIYEEQGIAGAEFSIYARETIYSPDGQTDEEGNPVIRYEKDALVGTIVTGEDGKGTLNNLPVGNYYIKETKTGDSFVLDPEEKDFSITYQGQEVAVDYVTKEIENQRQQVEISVVKKSSQTGEPLAGVVFGLYASEDILGADGSVLVKAGALIEKGPTGEDGTLAFSSDLPHGKYEIREVEHLPGYLPNGEPIEVDASYTDPTLEVIEITKEVENQPTVTEITKTDITGEKEVEGATLQVIDENGEVVEEWVSAAEPHVIHALAPGNYTLHEVSAPTEDGYVRAEDVAFTVEETGEIQQVSMKDDHTKVEISKTDITGEQEIEGAHLQILNKDGEVVKEWTSTREPYLVEYLAPGDYVLHEESAPEGFLIAEDAAFTVEETGEVQQVSMKDEVPMGRLVIKKTDAADGSALAGVGFTLTNQETGEVVAELTTGEDGTVASDLLPIAAYEDGKVIGDITYVLTETKPLEGYVAKDESYEITFSYQDAETKVIEVVQEITNEKAPDAPEEVKTGDDTMLIVPVIIGILALAGMILLIIRIRRTKR
ncbi:hypothetical protein H6B07_04045 [Mediterraneibacter glycyrrhizinilyticus]|nr:SpaA isopeptide-forming pilin-related protein [Mediterraneibacter glycyrrhizinilyticus]MBM6801850.1 hypothetical protein [Mediterraneibacter glycyrrhizinilyticus]